jgi:flagellar basal-body rod protein FlgB
VAITDIPILSMLRTRLDWSKARQRVLAENVAPIRLAPGRVILRP